MDNLDSTNDLRLNVPISKIDNSENVVKGTLTADEYNNLRNNVSNYSLLSSNNFTNNEYSLAKSLREQDVSVLEDVGTLNNILLRKSFDSENSNINKIASIKSNSQPNLANKLVLFKPKYANSDVVTIQIEGLPKKTLEGDYNSSRQKDFNPNSFYYVIYTNEKYYCGFAFNKRFSSNVPTPVGSVVYCYDFRLEAPAGYIVPKGQTLSSLDYPELKSSIQPNSFNLNKTFIVPDLRGHILTGAKRNNSWIKGLKWITGEFSFTNPEIASASIFSKFKMFGIRRFYKLYKHFVQPGNITATVRGDDIHSAYTYNRSLN